MLWLPDLRDDDRETAFRVGKQELVVRYDQTEGTHHPQRSTTFDMQFSPNLASLLKGLFVKNPKKRLGFNGAQEIKTHPWFDKVNWDNIYNKVIQAPFVPKVKSETDTSNFDVEFTSEAIESYQDAESFSEQANYAGFSFDERVKS